MDFSQKRHVNHQPNKREDGYKGTIFIYFIATALILGMVDLLYNLYGSVAFQGEEAKTFAGYLYTSFGIVVFLGLVWIGHYWYPRIARQFFLFALGITFVFAFPLEELRTIFVGMALPIVMAAFLVTPIYSFALWFIISAAYTLRLLLENALNPQHFFFAGLISLLVFAVVSWVIARSLEKALAETRALNEELDQRVQERTRELADALEREHETAVRNTTILESIADGVLFFDANQQIKIANPTANELAQQNLYNLTLPEILATVAEKPRAALKHWIDGKKPDDESNVKFEWYQKTISATVASVLLPTPNGQATDAGKVMVLRDFTKEAELEKAKAIFLGMISHELRTPMAAIKGYVKILLDTETDHLSETAVDYLQTVDISVTQLLSLANELIDLSRLESGEIELYADWLDVSFMIKQAAKIVEQEFASRNLSLILDLEDNLPKLYLDRNRTVQILLNLLSNAYKYTIKGGATVQVKQSDTQVIIAVIDTGIGINAANQANMFTRFFRADDQYVQKVSGTGLGLSITKGLVELHGGQLTFESTYGVGTTFRVHLPKFKHLLREESDEMIETT